MCFRKRADNLYEWEYSVLLLSIKKRLLKVLKWCALSLQSNCWKTLQGCFLGGWVIPDLPSAGFFLHFPLTHQVLLIVLDETRFEPMWQFLCSWLFNCQAISTAVDASSNLQPYYVVQATCGMNCPFVWNFFSIYKTVGHGLWARL